MERWWSCGEWHWQPTTLPFALSHTGFELAQASVRPSRLARQGSVKLMGRPAQGN